MGKELIEPWRKAFILKLYENTKDAVEVAKRNYLESRLANGLKREMRETWEKYEMFCSREENQQMYFETLNEFKALEEEIDAAMVQLKERSDEFVKVSAHALPYNVQDLSQDQVKQCQLPNYSRFLFDAKLLSFGPISERWEKLKLSFHQEFMNFFNASPSICTGRSYYGLSAASSIAISICENGHDEEPIINRSSTSTEGASSTKEDPERLSIPEEPPVILRRSFRSSTPVPPVLSGIHLLEVTEPPPRPTPAPEYVNVMPEVGRASSPQEEEVVEEEEEEFESEKNDTMPDDDSAAATGNKPKIVKRKRNYNDTLSGAWRQILTSAAGAAEANRIPSLHAGENRDSLGKP